MTDMDRARVITTAVAAGWRPPAAVAAGVTLADMLAHGDPYARFWTIPPTGEDRELLHPGIDGPPLAMAADAATTWRSTRAATVAARAAAAAESDARAATIRARTAAVEQDRARRAREWTAR